MPFEAILDFGLRPKTHIKWQKIPQEFEVLNESLHNYCRGRGSELVLLVTGGWSGSAGLASTELLGLGGHWAAWTPASPLPGPRWGLRAATLANTVIIMGTTSPQLLITSHDEAIARRQGRG